MPKAANAVNKSTTALCRPALFAVRDAANLITFERTGKHGQTETQIHRTTSTNRSTLAEIHSDFNSTNTVGGNVGNMCRFTQVNTVISCHRNV